MITKEEILALGVDISLRNDADIAELLSVGRTKITPTPIGVGTILAVMAPAGGLFLSSLRDIGAQRPQTMDSANVEWSLMLINRSEFDVGHPVTRAQLLAFATAAPEMATAITALLAVAESPDPVSVDEVSAILNSEG